MAFNIMEPIASCTYTKYDENISNLADGSQKSYVQCISIRLRLLCWAGVKIVNNPRKNRRKKL